MDGSIWQVKQDKLFKKFEFDNFAQALDFVNKVGNIAEEKNHHPDITFGWGYVEISLFTHSEKSVTDKDRELAKLIDELPSKLSA